MLITVKSLNTLKLDCIRLSSIDNFKRAMLDRVFTSKLSPFQYTTSFKRFLNYITEIQTLNSSNNLKTYNYKIVFLMGD